MEEACEGGWGWVAPDAKATDPAFDEYHPGDELVAPESSQTDGPSDASCDDFTEVPHQPEVLRRG